MAAKLYALAVILLLISIAGNAAAEEPQQCGSKSKGQCHDKSKALILKTIALFAILVTSMISVCLPMFSRKVSAFQPGKTMFVIVKAFASGVILATGYMHVLPDSFDCLTSECLPEHPWSKFPFTTFVAMLSAVLTLMVDSLSMSHYRKYLVRGAARGEDDENAKNSSSQIEPFGYGHDIKTEDGLDDKDSQLLRYRVVA